MHVHSVKGREEGKDGMKEEKDRRPHLRSLVSALVASGLVRDYLVDVVSPVYFPHDDRLN